MRLSSQRSERNAEIQVQLPTYDFPLPDKISFALISRDIPHSRKADSGILRSTNSSL